MRLKDICQLNPAYLGGNIEDTVSFVPMESLRNGNIDLKEISFSEAKGKYTYFADGDLLIAKVTPCFENGNIAVAENLKNGIGFGSSEIFVLRMNKDSLNKYVFYLSQTSHFQDSACATMCGVGGLKRISPLFFRTYEFNIPSLTEQQRIVNYLDKKLSAIDHRVEVLEKEKDAYSRLKNSVINQALTRGLKPNVDLKDSGIDWIGVIPRHWEIKRGKDFLKIVNGFPADSNLFSIDGSGLPLVRIRDISNLKTEVNYIGEVPSWALLKDNDLLIGMDGDFNVCFWNGGAAILNQRVCKISSKIADIHYICYSIAPKLKELNAKTNSTTVKHLSSYDIQNLYFAFPPLSEQQAIADYLDEKCAKIDAAIENISKQIDASKRLKKAIINEAISGKLFD